MLEWLFGKRTAGAEPAGTPAGEAEIAPAGSPDPAEHFKLGKQQYEMGRMDEALSSYRKALALKPDYAEAHNNAGNVYEATGRTDDAIASYRRALSCDATLANAHFNLGRLQEAQGDTEQALACYYMATAIDPNFREALAAEGNIYFERHEWTYAIAVFRKLIAIDAGNAAAHNLLGAAISRSDGDLAEALASFRKAIAIVPEYASAISNLGYALMQAGDHDEAMSVTRRAVAIEPRYLEGRSNLLFYISHDPAATAEEIYAEYRAFGELIEAPHRDGWPKHRNLPDPARRLRLGFVSADFRLHAVASFIEPLWAALDKSSLEVWAYSNTPLEDAVTHRLKAMVHNWRSIARKKDEELADLILDDGIDILFELSGPTGGHRLGVFARKPAPVQVSWIGNPNTTGLAAMDYYLADRYSAPPGLLDHLFTEKIVRLPSGSVFQPMASSPEVGELPALKRGALTFGSFNRSDKLVSGVIETWSRILHAVSDSRMLVGGIASEIARKSILERFATAGVSESRLELHLSSSMPEYLALHHQVDLILDSFPYTGGTTSYHAAWMGVPVLTIAGKTMASRVGLLINSNLGLPEFIVESEDAYVAKAVGWSKRIPELAALRAGLRARLQASPSCRPELVACWLERALRIMWEGWCAGKPPQSFGVDP